MSKQILHSDQMRGRQVGVCQRLQSQQVQIRQLLDLQHTPVSQKCILLLNLQAKRNPCTKLLHSSMEKERQGKLLAPNFST